MILGFNQINIIWDWIEFLKLYLVPSPFFLCNLTNGRTEQVVETMIRRYWTKVFTYNKQPVYAIIGVCSKSRLSIIQSYGLWLIHAAWLANVERERQYYRITDKIGLSNATLSNADLKLLWIDAYAKSADQLARAAFFRAVNAFQCLYLLVTARNNRLRWENAI